MEATVEKKIKQPLDAAGPSPWQAARQRVSAGGSQSDQFLKVPYGSQTVDLMGTSSIIHKWF